MSTPKQQLTYADIATELGISKIKLQSFVAEERDRRKTEWVPDASPKGSVVHYFSRRTADALKRAWTERRVTKTWKKVDKK